MIDTPIQGDPRVERVLRAAGCTDRCVLSRDFDVACLAHVVAHKRRASTTDDAVHYAAVRAERDPFADEARLVAWLRALHAAIDAWEARDG